MKLSSVLDRGIRSISYIIRNHKKELMLGILLMIILVGLATAVIYNSMLMQSRIGVEVN